MDYFVNFPYSFVYFLLVLSGFSEDHFYVHYFYNLRVHHAKKVKEWEEENKDKINPDYAIGKFQSKQTYYKI